MSDGLRWTVEQLFAANNPLDRALAETLENYRFIGLDGFGKKGVLDLIGTGVHEPQRLAALSNVSNPNVHFKIALPEEAYVWGAKFVWQILKELRTIICTKKYGRIDLTAYKNYPQGVSVALAGVIMNAIGVKEPTALGLATLVLIALGNATKNAFCKLTDEEVIEALDPNVQRRRKR